MRKTIALGYRLKKIKPPVVTDRSPMAQRQPQAPAVAMTVAK